MDYDLSAAIDLVKGGQRAKFVESVDMAVNLSLDKGMSVRGYCLLPFGSGRSVGRIAVITSSTRREEALSAGADVVGADDLIESIKGGECGFFKVIATPDMMPKLGKLGSILGPKKLMPTAKSGTVTEDFSSVIRDFKGGRVDFQSDKFGVLHSTIGRVSFDSSSLVKNCNAFIQGVFGLKPSDHKGVYFNSIYLSSTMGRSSYKLNFSDVLREK